MRSLIITAFGTILAGLLLYHLTLEKPELIYTLSDPITLLIEKKDSKIAVQQLEVKNIGDSEAKKIRTLINFRVISYEMIKYSKADDVKVFQSQDSFEVNYPSLPPKGSFKLTLKSAGIAKASLDVSHLGGIAKDAIEIRKWDASDFLSWTLALFYLSALVYFIRLLVLERWDSRPRYAYEDILRGKKPFYMNSGKWDSVRKESLDYKIERDESLFYSNSVEDSRSFKLLSYPKLDYVSDEEWDHLVKKAIKSVEDRISSDATTAYHPSTLLKLLKMDKPLHFSQDNWLELQEKINKSYITLRSTEFTPYVYSAEEMLPEINSTKPEGLTEEYWTKYMESCKKRYFSIISSDLQLKNQPMNYLQSHDLNVLKDEDRERLRKRAYQLELTTFGNLHLIENRNVSMKMRHLHQ